MMNWVACSYRYENNNGWWSTIVEKLILLFALSRGLCYLNGESWHFDMIANLRGDSSSTKVRNARHPRGTCENAAWRLHYFWGEKCPFLLEDSSPRATRARLVKILRTAYNWTESPPPALLALSLFPSSPSQPFLYLLYHIVFTKLQIIIQEEIEKSVS